MNRHHRSSDKELRSFGALVARKRIQKGITAFALAARMGISSTSLSRIENGGREPRFEIVRRLHRELDIAENVLNYLKGGNFND
jgi:transcriptional regulator with XRE-family HTH domain